MIEAKDEFRIFKRRYRDRDSRELVSTSVHYIQFRDHLRRRWRWPLYPSERQSKKAGAKILELVGARRAGEALSERLANFIESLPGDIVNRLIKAGIIDRQNILRGGALADHLEGVKDEAGKIVTSGYRQALEAKGDTAEHVDLTIQRIQRIFDACAFVTCADLRRPGAASSVTTFLGGLRTAGEINGSTYNKFIGALGGLLRWMTEDGRISVNPLANLRKVSNAETDADRRREFSVEEIRYLLDSVLKLGHEWPGMAAADRALLYRFCFETGMRPGQVRRLTKSSFNLDTDPPTVAAAAATTKGRRAHVQVIIPEMAAELRELFKAKVPTAPALKMPSKFQLARMLRKDLNEARTAWIEEAKGDAEERQRRHESDFLADVNHAGERADFYSLRHSHGSALASSGAPQSAIQKSLNHRTARTSERYIHVREKSLATTLGLLPTVKPIRLAMTGTDSAGPLAAPPPQPVATPKWEMHNRAMRRFWGKTTISLRAAGIEPARGLLPNGF